MKRLREWIENHAYLRFVDNWHKWPPLSWLMCKLGRHDFEFSHIEDDDWAVLECFYCERKRKSHAIDRGQG
jgi:hypothetical protein